MARVREIRVVTKEEAGAEADTEEEGGGKAAGLLNLNIETAGTEEEAAEGIAAALEMEVVEDEGSKGEEEGGGTPRALEALEFLTQEAEPSGTTLVDTRNGFNELSRLVMQWTMRHRWPAGARFAFNCYKHWAQLLLRQPGELPVTILSREGVTQGDPLSMVLYGITLIPLQRSFKQRIQGFLSPFYADNAAIDGSERCSAQLLKLLMKRRLGLGILP